MNTPTPGAQPGPPPPVVAHLACPECGSTRLSSVENLNAAGRCHGVDVRADGALEFDWTGWTDVHWDASETIGLCCEDCLHYDDEGGLQDVARRFTRVAGGRS